MFRFEKILTVKYIMLGLSMLLVSYAYSYETMQAPRVLIYNQSIDATVKNTSAAVFSDVKKSGSLVGYLPGATRVNIFPYEVKNGWVRADINWAHDGPFWIKRSDIAVGSDYRLYDKEWPLEYVFMTDGEGNNKIWVFTQDNRCSTNEANELITRIARKLLKPEKSVTCKELWEVPGTNLILANQQTERIDIWFNRKTNNIFINTMYGIEIGSLIYGYRNGKSVYVQTKCRPDRAVACFLHSGIKPSKIKNIVEPKQSFLPYK